MKIFLTGDRSLDETASTVLAGQVIGQLAAKAALEGEMLDFVTGDNDGFERGVRVICGTLNVLVDVIETPLDETDGVKDWDARHEIVNDLVEKVYFIHSAPLASSIGASLMRVMPAKVELVQFA